MSLAKRRHFTIAAARSGWPVLLLAGLLPGPALAAGMSAGDGSWASNPDMFSPVPVADTEAHWVPASPDAIYPFFDTDWSIASTGAFVRDDSGDRFKATVAPTVSLTHTGTRFSFGGTANGELTKTGGGDIMLDEALLSGTSTYEFDPLAKLTSNASLSMTQEDVHAADVSSDVAATPVEISGTADSTYTQEFGRFNLSLKGDAAREVFGPTTLVDGTSVDNTSQNNTQFGGELRLGFQLTPVVEVFTDTAATRTLFDAASPTLGTTLNGTEYSVKAGVAATWNPTLSASASIGLGVEHFDDPSLEEVRATLYDASLSYKPTEALSLTGDFSTSINAPGPNGNGTARIEYVATAKAAYLVNEWLGWRASADWHDARFAGTDNTDRGYGLGVGADYLVNRHTKLSADYKFDHSEITPSPPEDSQTVSIGLTVQK